MEQFPAMSTCDPDSAPAAVPRADRWWTLGLIVILVFLGVHFAGGLNRPWSEEDNWYGAVYSQAAHNNLRAGLRAAGVPATLYFGPLPIPAEAYYVHHPTLLPVLVTASFALLGESERDARLIPVLASLASVIVLWLLVRSAAGPRAATLSAAVFAAVPMELHYGDMVDFEPVLTLWMLGLLACVQRWGVTRRPPWAAGAALCAALAVWTDWPGYLLVLGTATWLLFFAPREMRKLGVLFVAIAGCAGLLFLWQIRSVNPAAWSDLWTALQMRLGNAIPTGIAPLTANAPHFTWGDWLMRFARDLHRNYLALTWVLVALGVVRVLRERQRSEGLRWLGLVAAQLMIAGALYAVLLRNESFIHDFASFYVIGAVALLAGLALDAFCRASSRSSWAVAGIVVVLAGLGMQRAEKMRSPYLILDGSVHESAQFIPDLGTVVEKAFPPGATVLANFDPYGSALTYYAQRPILTSVVSALDWRTVLDEKEAVGGVIWLGAPGAAELLASLPGPTRRIEIDGVAFALWPAPTASQSKSISSRRPSPPAAAPIDLLPHG